MKVIIKNLVKETAEFVECSHIKLDKERLVFFGNRVISIFLPENIEKENLIEEIEELFFNNQNAEIVIEKNNISIRKREKGGRIYGIS